MIRSSKPSPFTSPAEATEVPAGSFAASPLIWKPLAPVERREVEVGGEAARLAEHHIARSGLSRRSASATERR